jgi:hypothetical protein
MGVYLFARNQDDKMKRRQKPRGREKREEDVFVQ